MTSMKPVLLVTTVIIAASIFFAVINRLLERYGREKRKQEFYKLLEEKRYFKNTSEGSRFTCIREESPLIILHIMC